MDLYPVMLEYVVALLRLRWLGTLLDSGFWSCRNDFIAATRSSLDVCETEIEAVCRTVGAGGGIK